jgi:hypothetical protein
MQVTNDNLNTLFQATIFESFENPATFSSDSLPFHFINRNTINALFYYFFSHLAEFILREAVVKRLTF